jgi:hypothetical protein
MAKHYTPEEPTPVFAVTFVSNRKGIVPEPKDSTKPTGIDNTVEIAKLKEEIKKLDEYISDIAFSDSAFAGKEKARKEKSDLELKLAGLNLTSNNNKSKVLDTEYLVYSNVEIQPTSSSDLSIQSSWFLRDAEVEVTRDWPICKAKLIITCKLNDDGSIPSLKEIEQGFNYQLSPKKGDSTGKQVEYSLLPRGRFLGVDDEVRIYAGYKSNTCVSMDDLGQYPFKFNYFKTDNKQELTKDQVKTVTNYETILKDLDKIADISVDTPFRAKNSKDLDKIKQVLTNINGEFVVAPEVGRAKLVPFAVEFKLSERKTNLVITDDNSFKAFINNAKGQLELLISKYQLFNKVAIGEYDSKKPLAPIFWGFIDSVDFIGNISAGVQIIYNLRDRSRILADTKIITIPFLNAGSDEKGAFEGLRHKTIEGVYRASNGGIYLDNSYTSATSSQWRENFNPGSIITLWDNAYKDSKDPKKGRVSDQVKSIQENTNALAEERIKFAAAIENPARWVIANSFLQNEANSYDPLFHIWTLQPPLVAGSGPTTMQIINKSPFEILSYLANTEVMPIDFFCSHVNGHFMFAPRILDTTGLTDEERGNRLYFFFDCFDKVPESRSLIKDIRVTTSTIGVYNRFTVSSADFNNPTNSSLKDIVSVVDVASANTKNKKIPIKQHIIVDPKIKNASKELVGTSTAAAAQALALTTASTMARDNVTVIMKVIGDSSFYPGEAIRVYNTVLHSNGVLTFKNDGAQSLFLKTLYDEVQKIKSQQIKQVGQQEKIVTLDQALSNIRQVSGEETSQVNDVLPMYKIRAITHSLKAGGNDAGYTTKIIAIGDIL